MLSDYISSAMRHAEYKILGDGTYFGELPGFAGLWANAPTLEQTHQELRESLEDWLLVGLRRGHVLPVVDGIDLNVAKDVA